MRMSRLLAGALVLLARLAAAYEPGEKLVVLRPTEMKVVSGSTYVLTPAMTVTVRATEGERLKVAAGRVGTIDPTGLIPAAKADDYFTELIAKDPQDAAALRARGRLRFERGEHDKAMADLDQSIKLAPHSEAYTIRAFAWKRGKMDKDKALADFDKAIELNPKEALAWRVRGATYAGKADYAHALADYTESIRLDPENPDSLHHRVVMLSACMDNKIRNGKQAVLDATKACELSEWQEPLYLNGLAMASAEAGDFDAAIKWAEKASALLPGLGTANLALYKQHKPFRMTWR